MRRLRKADHVGESPTKSSNLNGGIGVTVSTSACGAECAGAIPVCHPNLVLKGMAKQMSYTDPHTGAVFPESYWRVGKINVDIHGLYAEITFYGYANSDCRQGGKNQIGSRGYLLQGQAFLAAWQQEITLQKSVAQICYETAVATQDVAGPVGPNGEAQFVSFFEGATDV